jgi:hypothetical protein
MPCDKLKASVFAAFGAPHTLLRNVQVSELNAGLQLYLTPAGRRLHLVEEGAIPLGGPPPVRLAPR